MRAALRRQAAVLLLVWAIAFSLLAAAYALPSGPTAALAVSDAAPFVGEAVTFNASASQAHDAGNGRIVAYAFEFGDDSGTGWVATAVVHHTYTRTGNLTAVVTVRDDRGLEGVASASLEVQTAPAAPFLVLEHASVEPAQPRVGDNVTVAVTIFNGGNATATAATITFADLRPDGSTFRFGDRFLPASLPPAASVQVVSAPFEATQAGDHTIRIGLQNVTPASPGGDPSEFDLPLAVLAAGSTAPPPAIDPAVIGLSAAAAASAAGAIYLLRRRPPGSLEPPPESPPDRSPPPIWPP